MNSFTPYKNGVLAACLLSVSMIASGVAADDTDKKMTRSEKAIAKYNERYIETDKTKKCVNTRRIQSTQVLSDQMILFRMRGSPDYVMKLERKCPGLFFENRFSYRLHTTQLCGLDIITVLDSFGRSRVSCGLDDFVALKERPDDAPAEVSSSKD